MIKDGVGGKGIARSLVVLFSMLREIYSGKEQTFSFFTLMARICKRDNGISPQREELMLATKAICKTPQTAARRLYPQPRPPASESLRSFSSSLAVRHFRSERGMPFQIHQFAIWHQQASRIPTQIPTNIRR